MPSVAANAAKANSEKTPTYTTSAQLFLVHSPTVTTEMVRDEVLKPLGFGGDKIRGGRATTRGDGRPRYEGGFMLALFSSHEEADSGVLTLRSSKYANYIRRVGEPRPWARQRRTTIPAEEAPLGETDRAAASTISRSTSSREQGNQPSTTSAKGTCTTSHSPDPSSATSSISSHRVQLSSPKLSPENFELVSYLPPIVVGEELLKIEPYVLPGGDENDGIFVCTAAKRGLQVRTAPGPFDLRPFWENTALNVRVQGLQIDATPPHQKRRVQRRVQLLLAMLKYQSNGIQPLAIQVVPSQPEAGVLVVGADEVLTVRLCLQDPDEGTLLTLTLHEKRLFSSQYELRHDPVTSSSSSSSSSAGLVWKRKNRSPSSFGDMQIIQGRAEDLRQYAKFENDKCHFFAKHCGSGWPAQEVTHCSIVQVTPWGPPAVTQGSSFGWAMGVVDEDC